MELQKHKMELDSMIESRDLDMQASERREEQSVMLMQAAVEAAETGGENKDSQRLYQYQEQELIRHREERAIDTRRYQEATERARVEQRRREVAMAAASAAPAAERLRLAAMTLPRQQQQQNGQVQQW